MSLPSSRIGANSAVTSNARPLHGWPSRRLPRGGTRARVAARQGLVDGAEFRRRDAKQFEALEEFEHLLVLGAQPAEGEPPAAGGQHLAGLQQAAVERAGEALDQAEVEDDRL